MQPITPTLRFNDSGPQVVNLQEAILALIEKGVFKPDDVQSLADKLRAEQTQQSFGESTTVLVRRFQIKQGLGDQLDGVVEDTTAAKLNELLRSYGLLDEPVIVGEFVVEGVVTRPGPDGEKGVAVSGVTVQAFDQDLSGATTLGEAVTDDKGKYQIPFTEEQYLKGDVGFATPVALSPFLVHVAQVAPPKVLKSGPDLWVGIPGEGDKYRVKSDIFFNCGQHTVIDLALPLPVVPPDSEFEELVRLIIPRLGNVKLETLTESQVDFLSKDTEQPAEPIAALVAAERMIAAAKALANHQNFDIGKLEPVLFTGFYAFLRVQPTYNFAAVLNQRQTWWAETLDDAFRQNRIPKSVSPEKENLIELLNQLRALRTLEPAKEKAPASLGDLFNTLKGDWLTPDIRQQTVRVLQDVAVESGEFMTKLKEVIPNETQRNEVRRTLRLGELTKQHAPMVAAIQPIAGESGDDSLRALAAVPTDRWLDLAYTHGAPVASFLTPEQYALQLEEAVEAQSPTAVLANKLQTHPFFTQTPEYSSLAPALQKHSQFDVASGDIEAFAKEADLTSEQEPSVRKLQHLKRMGARWQEAGTLLEKGVDSIATVTDMGKQQFISQLKDDLDESRLSAIYDNAIAIQAVSIGVMGYVQPLLSGVGSAVTQSFNYRGKDREVIDSSPTLRKLFGALEQCACDPCLSVLSPAAYLADLLKFIDASPKAGQELSRRRPDIYDLELSCENSKIELPQIDLAIEILESAVAFPRRIPLPPGSDVEAGLKAPQISKEIQDALQLTATESLGELSAQQDLRKNTGAPGVSYWTVTDRYRRWVLKATREFFGLKQDLRLTAQEVKTAVRILDEETAEGPNLPKLDQALAGIISNKLPFDIRFTSVKKIESSRRWTLGFTGSITVTIDDDSGKVVFSNAAGQQVIVPSEKSYSAKTLEVVRVSLNARKLPPIFNSLISLPKTQDEVGVGLVITAKASDWRLEVLSEETLFFNPALLEITGLSYQSTPTDRDLFARPQNRNPLAYDNLSDENACFPWSLPYDHSLTETRETLRAAGISRLELLETSSSQNTHYSSVEIARERLGLCSAEWELISKPKNASEIWGAWGLKITSADQKTSLRDTFIDEVLNKYPLGNEGLLTRVSIVLQQARLSFGELEELLQTDFVNPGRAVQVSPDNVCQPSAMTLSNVNVEFLDRLHRFVRLWRATGWPIWEVDLAIQSPAIGNKVIDENALIEIANLILLKERLGLSVEALAAMFGGFWNRRYNHAKDNKILEIIPLYERIFQNRQLVDPPDPTLAYSAAANSEVLPTDKTALIAVALGVRAADLAVLIERLDTGKVDPLKLDNNGRPIPFPILCRIFRNVVLARALKLSAKDYARAWSLLDKTPTGPTPGRTLTPSPFNSPTALLEVLDMITFVSESGFTWSELEYILQGTSGDEFDQGLTAARALEILRGLQRELQQLPTNEEGVEDKRFRLSPEDLNMPPFSGLPGSAEERWLERWRLTKVDPGGMLWSVSDPSNPNNPIYERDPLDLLSRIDVLAQQAGQLAKTIKEALKTAFVNPTYDPTKVLTITNVDGVEIAKNLSELHLDRLERFLALLKLTQLDTADLDSLLQAFCKTVSEREPLRWDLTKLPEVGVPVLSLRNLLRLKVMDIAAWWPGKVGDRDTPLSQALNLSKDELSRIRSLFEAEYMKPANTDVWDSPSTLLVFVRSISLLKQRLELIVQHLAKAMAIDPILADILLWEYLSTNEAKPRQAIHIFAGPDFSDAVNPINDDAGLKKSLYHPVLLRLHKTALLNLRWKASNDEMRLLPKDRVSKNSFVGLVLNDLPASKKKDAVAITEWQRSTALFRLAHLDAAMSQTLVAYLKAFRSPATDRPSEEALEKLKDLFGFPSDSETVEIAAKKLLGITSDKHLLDPLRLSELVRLLGLLQRLGINEIALKTLIADTPIADTPTNPTHLGRMLLRPRFGESGWQQALKGVSNTLRIQQRDRLVDFLLAKENLGENVQDANSLYEHYLIDVEMSPCMNTTRLLQSTAAAQLFVQRCLLNLERKHGISPSAINRQRWEWMQNYRVWEANRKVFLYPENWLFPEVRDDRSETFRAFESALTQNEPSHENAVKALRKYLDDLVEVSQISVLGMYEHTEENDQHDRDGQPIFRRTLYLVGRSPNPPYSFFWRKAINFGAPGMRWTGWERVDQDLSGDHIIPFIFEGDFHIAWPLIKQIDKATTPYYEIQLAWTRRTSTGWTKRKISRDSLPFEKLFNRDERSMFAFRWVSPDPGQPERQEARIDLFVAERISTSLPLPAKVNTVTPGVYINPNPYGKTWKLTINAQAFVQYQGSRVAKVPMDFTIHGLRWDSDLSKGPGFYPGSDSDYVAAQNSHPAFEHPDINDDVNLKLVGRAFNQTHEISVDQISGMTGGSSAWINVDFIFTNVPDPDSSSTDPNAPLPMINKGRFVLVSGNDAVWYASQSANRISPKSNSFFYSGGWMEIGGGGIPPFQPGFPERMFLLPASQAAKTPSQTYYLEETGRRMIAREPEVGGDWFGLYPCGYSEAYLYLERERMGQRYLYDVEIQRKGQNSWFNVDAISQWVGPRRITGDPRDNTILGFNLALPYGGYNWEVFYHLPLAIATFLSRQHRFEDARRWFHFVFDPTTNDSSTGHQRFWRFLPFRNAQAPATITQLLETLANPNAPANQKKEVNQQIAAWLEDPFNPFAVARLRTSAFEWYTVIAYIKNLFAWADQLFRRDTRESINEATLLYVMAAQILGPRPEKIRARGVARQSLSYRALKTLKGEMDDFSNTWLTLADSPLVKAMLEFIKGFTNISGINPHAYDDLIAQLEQLSSIGSLYFCVPPNEKLPELWDQVEDRLFNIRHCQNIEGVTRSLPLYEPPIDPELLIRAKAAGVDLADVLADRFSPLPHYRFQALLQKANEFCNEVKGLGGALLSAIEKKEAEHLALLKSSQEMEMLKLIELVKQEQVEEVEANIESLQKTRNNALDRFLFLHHQLGNTQISFDESGVPIVERSLIARVQETGAPDGFNSLSLIQPEVDQIRYMELSNIFSTIAGAHRHLAGVNHFVGLYFPYKSFAEAAGFALSAFADGFATVASYMSFLEHRSSQMAIWQRRHDDWVQQSKMTAEEIRQIDKQIIALRIRKSITEKELENHRKQMEHASNIDDYLRHLKFSGESLYAWTESQLSGLYFTAYQMAYDLAKRAERAFRFELGDDTASFVQFGHWDNMRKGLLSGERLSQDLRRMEVAYLDKNRREYEITKHVSLRQLDPLALIGFRQTGECEFNIPEALFDLDFPGHYFRRIKSVSVTLPCVVGPYASVSATLTLLSSKLRVEKSIDQNSDLDGKNFRASYLPTQSIATSTGQNDAGVFELNFRDERYLPFEGAGVISNWRLELPSDFHQFDYDTISDVILHIRYTAREGGENLKTGAKGNLEEAVNKIAKLGDKEGLLRVFSIRHEFPAEWQKFKQDKQEIVLKINKDHFPFWTQGRIGFAKDDLLLSDEGSTVTAVTRQEDHWKVSVTASATAKDILIICRYSLLTN